MDYDANDVKVSSVHELKICKKCEKMYFSHDMIPLCPECRYEEAKYHL